MRSALMCVVVMGLCLSACETNVPDENGNKSGVKDGAITKGVFSVAEGKQVRFSMGNLQYQASTKTWRFASQQYEYIGDDNKNISDTYDGWIDLFGWGTGDNPTNTSINNEDYATFVDWGTNAISNGGNKPNQWRTLTSDEWEYIIGGRLNAKTLYSSAQIRINGNTTIVGMIILPDNWSSPKGIAFYSGMSGWTSNDYDISQWTKLENAGAVFLPASGGRDGLHTSNMQNIGCCWSSTRDNDCMWAYGLSFGCTYLPTTKCGWIARISGASVRVVQDM